MSGVYIMEIPEDTWNAAQSAEHNYWIRRGTRGLNKDAIDRLLYFYEVGLSFGGKVVVEVGCGLGNFLRVITAKERIGIEPLLDKFSEIFDMDVPGIQFIKGKGESIPLPDDKADVVFCSNVLNHVQYPEMCLKEIHRIIKNDGILYFDTHFDYQSVLHPHVFTRKSICKLLEKYFSIEKVIDKEFKWGSVCRWKKV